MHKVDTGPTDALELPQVRRPACMTTQEYAYQRLRKALILGTIAPGVSLTIRGLACALGMSPTPVREALRRLGSEHAITVLENRRIRVPVMSPERLRELVALRAAVESHAAVRTLPHLTDLAIDHLAQIDDELTTAVARRDLDQQVMLNQQFHRTLYVANPQSVVIPVIESIWLQLGPFLRIAGNHVHDLYHVDRHAEALAALRKRDADALAQAIRDDIYEGVGQLDADAIRTLLDAAG